MATHVSTHQKIYDTRNLPDDEALAIVGGATITDRRNRLNAFLSENDWNLEAFMKWLPSYNRSQAKPCNSLKQNQALPSRTQMAKNLASAGAAAIKHRFRTVSKKEQNRRHGICETNACGFYLSDSDRCAKCGCFTAFKAKLKAWHCPIDEW